jgi:hypothetical protein
LHKEIVTSQKVLDDLIALGVVERTRFDLHFAVSDIGTHSFG